MGPRLADTAWIERRDRGMLRGTMRSPRSLSSAALLALLLATLSAACGAAGETQDPLAVEIERWSAFLGSDAIDGRFREANQAALARAAEALRNGRRLLALQRLATARLNLATAVYMQERPAGQRQDPAAFEAEWSRMGKVLRDDLGAPSAAAFDGVQPAAVRAVGEAALPQVRAYYQASREYGRSTTPANGLFYLGNAQAQRELVAFCRSLSKPSGRRALPLRDLGPELDALETEILAAYRPPASIDRHGEFIVAGSTLKEARELNAAGLYHGALLRYLQAALLLAPLRQAPPALAAAALAKRLGELETRLSEEGVDYSIGQLLLESAQAHAAGAAPGTSPELAAAIAGDVLPRYFAALAPARPASPKPPEPAPQVTVRLVRWPYT
jgi:hypothetical protein